MPISYLFKVLGMSMGDVLSYFYKSYKLEYTNNNWIIDIIPPLGKSVAIEYFETDAVSGILVK